MNINLNFEKTDLSKLLNHIKWLQEIGLISSYNVNPSENEGDETDKYIQQMLEEAEKDIEEGRVYTTEQAMKILADWQQLQK